MNANPFENITMRHLLMAGAAILLLSRPALARPEANLRGRVVAAQAHWNSDKTQILTIATIETANGTRIDVTQSGGTVDGIGMMTFHAPPLLSIGDIVALQTRPPSSLHAGTTHTLVSIVERQSSHYARSGFTEGGNALYWESSCVEFYLDAAGTSHLPGELEFELAEQAIAHWNDSIASCSYMNIRIAGRHDGETGKDLKNVLKFRHEVWERPATRTEEAKPFSERAYAVTTVSYINDATSPRDGAIVDADIHMNAVHNSISHNGQSLGSHSCLADFRAVFTHEIGHVLGLGHTCRLVDDAENDPVLKDHNGNDTKLCSELGDNPDPIITTATMYPDTACGETSMATLEADDIAAVCKVYPKANDPGTCEPVQASSGCACTATTTNTAAPISLAMLLLLTMTARRRSQ